MHKTPEFGRCSLVIALLIGAGLTACNRAADSPASETQAPTTTVADSDPAAGNLAPVTQNVSTAPQVAQNGSTDYGNSAPPPVYGDTPPPADYADSASDLQADNQDYPPDSGYDTSSSDQPIEASDPPPPLPDYTQPEIPGDNYYWTPGYWAYSDGYYWVPGAWVLVPWVNALWTPPYWGYEGGHYRWHGGYWGTHVGFYGGINYGFGYTGRGYYGAYWNHGALSYNRAVMNVNVTTVHNVYNYPVSNRSENRVSYNGGRGGITARPTAQEMAVVRDPRTPPVTAQVQHAREAAGNRGQFVSQGHAQPAALAATQPLRTSYRAPAGRPPAAAMRVAARPATPNEPQRAMPEGRPAQQQPAPLQRPMPESRAPQPESRPAPEARQAPQVETRPAPEVRQSPQPAQRPVPDARPAAQPERRPAPEVRQAPQPAQRPAPGVRQAPQPAQRPAPEARPTPQPAQRAAPEARPAPQPAQRPAPEARPAPQPAQRPTPEARPAPQPAQRPAPEARQAPQPAQRPAPEARPAPQPARPEPAKKPEEKDKKQ